MVPYGVPQYVIRGVTAPLIRQSGPTYANLSRQTLVALQAARPLRSSQQLGVH